MKNALRLLAATTLAFATVPATAATLFATTLSGTKETVPNASPATGVGSLLLNDTMDSVDISLSWTGLIGGFATGAHIHCCAFQGANGPVAIDFGPDSVATGSLTRTYDLTLASTYGGGFLGANGGSAVNARASLLAGLFSGRTYFNVHNAQFPGGEIRGQLAAVPEPATWGMMIIGFAAVGGAMRARKRSLPAGAVANA